jgi:hypothetical protein
MGFIRADRVGMSVFLALVMVPVIWAGDTEGRWIEDGLTGIQVWDVDPKESTVVSWSGGSESDRASGFGVLSVFVDGKLIGRYTGTMSDGRAKGEGEVIWMEEGERFAYKGGFLDGEPHGLGMMTYQDGSTLESIFVEGDIGDYGVYRGANGEQYDGQLVSAKPDGEGLHICDSGEIYKGEFAVGRRSGKGEVLLPDGTVMSGDFIDDEMNGVGRVAFPDGSVYEGEMKDDKATGKGAYRTPDGTVFRGQFVSNQPDGSFKVTKPDGTTSTEVWKMGEKTIW